MKLITNELNHAIIIKIYLYKIIYFHFITILPAKIIALFNSKFTLHYYNNKKKFE